MKLIRILKLLLGIEERILMAPTMIEQSDFRDTDGARAKRDEQVRALGRRYVLARER